MIYRKLSLIGLLLSLTSQVSIAGDRPNILLIMADDLGFSDLGCYGGEIATPNLDSVAENGLRYTQFYNTARCWPTRAALLTGFYAQQVRRDSIPGAVSINQGTRPDWAPLLPRYLKPAGYRSHQTGKWHIDGLPINEGFDRSYYLQDQDRFFSPSKHWKDDVPLPVVKKEDGYYSTIALADHVIEVLDEHHTKHSEQPFFHYLAFSAPHFPLHALPEDIAKYQELYQVGWDVIREKRWEKIRELGLPVGDKLSEVEREIGPPYHRDEPFEILGSGEVNKPVPWNSLTEQQKKFQTNKMAIHAAMIHRMDIEIGRVFEQIKKMGQWENTLVMFLSDNGASAEIMVRGDGHDPAAAPGSAETYLCLGPGWSTACNTPFRRHKTWTHEGGISTPMIISWPKGIASRGELRTTPGHVIDVVPTILDITGAKDVATDGPDSPGKSLVATFTENSIVERSHLWWFHDGHKAVMKDGWKAVAANGGKWDLYDLRANRAEAIDHSGEEPEKVIELVKIWDDQLAEFKALALSSMSEEESEAQRQAMARGRRNSSAQRDALPPRKQSLFNAQSFKIKGHPAFVMNPEKPAPGKPWIFYGPTLPSSPDRAESWMHQQFLKAGIAVAGVDVGEAYGSPVVIPVFDALYTKMQELGFAKKPILLGRSRGGLWVSSWAVNNPELVTAIAGIYPVYDVSTYPGLKRAASAYEMTAEELETKLPEVNPVEKASILAKHKIPVFIIHGEEDTVVPLAENSGRLEQIYRQNQVGDLLTLVRIKDQGHSFWPGYFNSQELVDFVIKQALTNKHLSAESDVVVYGGTPGGITASISAAREGASVILLEQTRHVGGLATSGLNRDECNHLDRQTLGGLCEQFLEEAVKRSDGRWTEGSSRTWQSGIAEQVFLEMLKEAGVEVRYEQLLDHVKKDGTRITELRVQGGESYQAKVFIDATYEGDLMAGAGVSYAIGRESAEQYGESIAGVRYLDDKVAISPFDDDGKRLFGVMPGKPPEAGSASEVPICYNVRMNLTTNEATRVPIEKPTSYDAMQHELLARALEAGLFKNLTAIIGLYPMGDSDKRELNNRQFSIVSMSIPGAQTPWAEASFEEREAIHQKYRDYTHGMLWFLKSDPRVPEHIRGEMAPYGFCKDEWADNDHWPYYLYIRAARRMQGEIILTEADVIEDVDKEDVIHVGSHFIDCHHAARYVSDSGHIINEGRIWKVGTRFDIPYRAITPKASECSNLLVPVCASASHVAFCTIRLEPTWMQMGEAAGIAAVMAANSDKPVQAVDIQSLQDRLLELGIPLEHPEGPMAYEKKHGKPRTFAPDDVVKEFFASADKNGDGMASKSEWDSARPTWEWLFDHIDKDKNGQLDRTEYKAFQVFKKENPDWRKMLESK